MTTRTLDELRELAPGYVMQLLTADEQQAFEAALRDPAIASVLSAEVEAHRHTVELLATSQPVAPPPALRNRVQERLRAEAANTSRVVPAAPERPQLSVVRDEPRRRVMPIVFALAFAASAFVALRLDRQVRALRATVDEQRIATTRLTQQLAARERTLRTLTEGGNQLLLVRLAPGAVTGANMQVFWNVKNGQAVVFAAGLRALPESRSYQLWMIHDGKPVSVAVFRPDASGKQLMSDIAMPSSAAGVAAFALTEEPAGGSPQPTMTPFLVGTVAAPQ